MSYNGDWGTDFFAEVRMGKIPGYSMVHKLGRNDAVPNGSWKFVNLLGFPAWPLVAPRTVRIKAGGNAADIAGGLGAQEVTIQGIAASGEELTEAIVTAGALVSATTSLGWYRVHRAYVTPLKCGTYGGSNIGDIIIENSTGTRDMIQIAADEGQTQFCGFSIPIAKTGYLVSVNVTVDSLKPADIRLMTREDLMTVTPPCSPVRLKKHWDGVSGAMPPYVPRSPDVTLNALTDVWIEAKGSSVTEVSATMEILMVDD